MCEKEGRESETYFVNEYRLNSLDGVRMILEQLVSFDKEIIEIYCVRLLQLSLIVRPDDRDPFSLVLISVDLDV